MSQIEVTNVLALTGWEIEGTPAGVRACGTFEDRAAAEAFAAQFPKWVGVKAAIISAAGDPSDVRGWVTFDASLTKDGVNGGINETGIKRYRRLVEIMDKLDLPLAWNGKYLHFKNSYETREAFEASLNGR